MARKSIQLITSYATIVGAVIVHRRQVLGMTQAGLAERVGLAPSTWSRVETGTSALSVPQLARAAEVLSLIHI